MERKGINPSVKFVFISTWNVSFRTRERNKKEQLFLLQEKIGMKKNVYLYLSKSGTERNNSFSSGNVERIEINTKVFI